MRSTLVPARRAATVAAVAVLAVVIVPQVVGGTGVGAVLNLGKTNAVSATTTLTGSASGKMLQVTDTGIGSALSLTTKTTVAPMKVNSSVKVVNLNADKLDGVDSTGFLQPSGKVVISGNTGDWRHTDAYVTSVTEDYGQGGFTAFHATASVAETVRLAFETPVALYGKGLIPRSVEFCYDASGTASLNQVTLYKNNQSTGATGSTSIVAADYASRGDAACRVISAGALVPLTPQDQLFLQFSVGFTNGSTFKAGRATLSFDATTNAVP